MPDCHQLILQKTGEERNEVEFVDGSVSGSIDRGRRDPGNK
jgi:hypothetical protein